MYNSQQNPLTVYFIKHVKDLAVFLKSENFLWGNVKVTFVEKSKVKTINFQRD